MSRIESEARSLLLDRRDALCRAHASGGSGPGFAPDEFDAETVVADQVFRELAEVDAALRRIAAGSYGSCSACGGPLGLQRLRAIPEARFCLGCSGHRPEDD